MPIPRPPFPNPCHPVPFPPALQHLVHLHMVSQLHAIDGGTTYGLPYDKLVPPVHTDNQDVGPGVLTFLGCKLALRLWLACLSFAPPHDKDVCPQLRPRVMIKLLLRLARAAVDSWQRSRGSNRTNGGGGGGGGRSDSGSIGQASGQRPNAAPCLVLYPESCPGVAAHALATARQLLAHCPAPAGRARQGEPAGSDANVSVPAAAAAAGADGGVGSHSGSSPRGHAHGDVKHGLSEVDAGAAGGPAEGAGGGGGGGGSTAVEHEETMWLSWASRRRLADTWWPLVVGAVHATLDDGAARGDEEVAELKHVCSILSLTWAVPQEQHPEQAAGAGKRVPYLAVGVARRVLYGCVGRGEALACRHQSLKSR